MNKDELLSILEGGSVPPELWPNVFKYLNFEFPKVKDTLNLRRLILADLQMGGGLYLMGHEPPLDFFEGYQKCIDALTAIVMDEYEERRNA